MRLNTTGVLSIAALPAGPTYRSVSSVVPTAFRVNAPRHHADFLFPQYTLQPLVRQFRGPPVEFVGAPFDVGEHVDDPGQVVKVTAAAVSRRGRVHRVVAVARSRGDDRLFLRRGDERLRVAVDGQVAVGAEVPGQEIADSPRQRVRV